MNPFDRPFVEPLDAALLVGTSRFDEAAAAARAYGVPPEALLYEPAEPVDDDPWTTFVVRSHER